MQRFVSNWLCVSTVFYKKNYGKKLNLFFLPPTFTSDMSEKKIANHEFYFYFFFVLRVGVTSGRKNL